MAPAFSTLNSPEGQPVLRALDTNRTGYGLSPAGNEREKLKERRRQFENTSRDQIMASFNSPEDQPVLRDASYSISPAIVEKINERRRRQSADRLRSVDILLSPKTPDFAEVRQKARRLLAIETHSVRMPALGSNAEADSASVALPPGEQPDLHHLDGDWEADSASGAHPLQQQPAGEHNIDGDREADSALIPRPLSQQPGRRDPDGDREDSEQQCALDADKPAPAQVGVVSTCLRPVCPAQSSALERQKREAARREFKIERRNIPGHLSAFDLMAKSLNLQHLTAATYDTAVAAHADTQHIRRWTASADQARQTSDAKLDAKLGNIESLVLDLADRYGRTQAAGERNYQAKRADALQNILDEKNKADDRKTLTAKRVAAVAKASSRKPPSQQRAEAAHINRFTEETKTKVKKKKKEVFFF